MRKKILIIIPAAILLLISVILIIIAIVVFTEKNNSASYIKADSITDVETTELEVDGMKLYCKNVSKDNKNNFIIEAGGYIRINPTEFEIIGIKNGDILAVSLANSEGIILLEGTLKDSYYQYNIKDQKDSGYTFVIENQSANDINIGYIKYWK